jgi:hypothetical protein
MGRVVERLQAAQSGTRWAESSASGASTGDHPAGPDPERDDDDDRSK